MKHAPKQQAKRETVILPCSCANAYQDDTYGAGKRVHNPSATGYRCTVCSKEKASH